MSASTALDRMDRVAAQELRAALAEVPTSVAAVGAMTENGPLSFIASTFVGISLDPPIVSLSFQKSSQRWKALQACQHVGVTILARHHGPRTRQLAASGANNYDGLDVVTTDRGEVFIADGLRGFGCDLAQVIDAGDHDIALLHVDEIRALNGSEPLVFHASKFRRLAADHMTAADWLSATEWH